MGPATLLALAEQAAERLGSGPSGGAWLNQTRATLHLAAGDPAGSLERSLAAARLFEASGDARNTCIQRMIVGFVLNEVGAYAEAEGVLREALATAGQRGLPTVMAGAKANLSRSLCRQGRVGESLSLMQEGIRALKAQGNRRLEGASRIYLADILLAGGDLDGAEREAREAIRMLDPSLVRLALAEALDRTGDRGAACRAIAAARERLVARAAKINDPRRRASFLGNVREHVRTLELAAAMLDAGA